MYSRSNRYRRPTARGGLWLPLTVAAILVLLTALAACGGQAASEAGSGQMEHEMDEGAGQVQVGGAEVTHGHLRLKGIWSRPGLQGNNGVIYLTLSNDGQEADRLVGVQTDVAQAAELHQVRMENDVMKMEPVAGGLEIPAGGQVALEPGGYHVMLVDLNQNLKAGESFSVLLQFEKEGEIMVDVEISQP